MHIKSARFTKFRRFTDLTITDIPATARLVMLTGPNGTGKSAIFDGFNEWSRRSGAWGVRNDPAYYDKLCEYEHPRQVIVTLHDSSSGSRADARKSFWIRSAYRNTSDFTTRTIEKAPPIADREPVNKMIDADNLVAEHYQRLVGQVFEWVFDSNADVAATVGVLRERTVGRLRDLLQQLFPDLRLEGPGQPLDTGTFLFTKGTSTGFHYKNLSGGEKAAFDLILDMVVRATEFQHTVYCIDEPELHIGTRVQRRMLTAMLDILPPNSQLWLSSHSLGLLRAAHDLYRLRPSEVVFLDTAEADFDTPCTLVPKPVNRAFFKRMLSVALDDLAELVAPAQVVLCEGSTPRDFDARCYRAIFSEEYPDVEFLPLGGAGEVVADRMGIGTAVQTISAATQVFKLIDRDDRSEAEIGELRSQGVHVLSKRSIESYLLDDEILQLVAEVNGSPESADDLRRIKRDALASCVARQRPADDLKAARDEIYLGIRRRLGLSGAGSTTEAWLTDHVVKLVSPRTAIYATLEEDVFGGGRGEDNP